MDENETRQQMIRNLKAFGFERVHDVSSEEYPLMRMPAPRPNEPDRDVVAHFMSKEMRVGTARSGDLMIIFNETSVSIFYRGRGALKKLVSTIRSML